ncbi:chemerin-like receptor 1 [Amphiprion ocellaris]|uniref:G-protein coupled receptors family 1 profile domain-containing protein n=1 Tax=Amphiprion ocellaris TaxID=80972 RepID=A0A3Q1ANT1_AMPOC|nr:chemerin-like receptor 1 [Amphiprion ocellaris]
MGTDNTTSSVSQTSGVDVAVRYMKTVYLVMYCLIFIVGTLGNGLVIYVTGFRMKRTVNSVWFLNLALADFLFTVFLVFVIVSHSRGNQWDFGLLMCKLNTFVSAVNMFASVFLLTAISLDRCLSIWVVVWAHNRRTVFKAQLACVVIWVAAGICSAPYASFRSISQRNGSPRCVYPAAVTHEQKWIIYTFRCVVGFVIPFLVILISYVAIAVRANRLQRTRRPKSRRIIYAVILAFFICWLPFHVISFIELKISSNTELVNIVRIGGPLAGCLAFLNSCLNPILYVFMCDEFLKKLKQSICLVLESALTEDHLSFMSSRSLSSHFSRISRKSDSTAPTERKGTDASLTFTECKQEDTLSTE